VQFPLLEYDLLLTFYGMRRAWTAATGELSASHEKRIKSPIIHECIFKKPKEKKSDCDVFFKSSSHYFTKINNLRLIIFQNG